MTLLFLHKKKIEFFTDIYWWYQNKLRDSKSKCPFTG